MLLRKTLDDGELAVPHRGGTKPGLGSSTSTSDDTSEYVVKVNGYYEASIPSASDLFVSKAAAPFVVLLRSESDKAFLKLHSQGLAVDAGLLALHSESTGELMLVNGVGSDLRYGPFERTGETVRVSSVVPLRVGNRVGYSLKLIGSAKWVDSGYELAYQEERGAISVRGDRLPMLRCRSINGAFFDASLNDGSICLFDRLIPGQYLVGQAKVLDGPIKTIQKSSRIFRVEVVSGKTAVIKPHSDWSQQTTVSGSIRYDASFPKPILLAGFHEDLLPLGVSGAYQEISVATNGNYQIPPHWPMPKCIIAADRTANGVRVRGVFSPGTKNVLDEKLIRLKDENNRSYDISYKPNWDAAGALNTGPVRVVDFSIDVTEGGVDVCVPIDITTIIVKRQNDGISGELKVKPDGVSVLDLGSMLEGR